MKKTQKQLLFQNLLNSKNFYGSNLKDINQKNVLSYIYGIRSKRLIIDLEITLFTLKRIFNLIKFLLRQNQKIILIGNNIQSKIFKKIFLNNKSVIFITTTSLKDFAINPIIKKQKQIGLIIFFNIQNNHLFLKKMLQFNKPIVTFSDTQDYIDLKKINYPVFNNNQNLKSFYFLIYIFNKILNK